MKTITLAEAVKRVQTEVEGYIAVGVELIKYADGHEALEWRVYSGIIGESGRGPNLDDAILTMKRNKGLIKPDYQDVEVEVTE